MKSSLFALILLLSSQGQAYLENIRHGYTSCQTCHVNPQGGSLLTPYGKALGPEIMFTTTGASADSGEPQNKWWATGANLRGLQVIKENSAKIKSVFIPMQTDAHLAAGMEKIRGHITYGTKSTNSFGERKTTSLIRQGYLVYDATENILVQTGKFAVPFGLPVPDHNLLIKKTLGFSQNRETNNFLGLWSSEQLQASVYIFDRLPEPTDASNKISKGSGLQIKYFLNSKNYLSLSQFSEDEKRLWGLSGFASFDVYNSGFFFEYDTSFKNQDQENIGFVRYLIEPKQGIKPFVQFENRTSFYERADRQEDGWAVGLQWLPRENIDVMFQVGQSAVGHFEQENLAFINIHLYGQYP